MPKKAVNSYHYMDNLDFILDKYQIKKKSKVIEIFGTRHGTLPKLFRQLGFTNGAEIGVAQGYFSKHLLRVVPNLKLYSIDAWKVFSGCTHGETKKTMDNLYKRAKARLSNYNCKIIRKWSMDAVKKFEDKSLDFVYIDAAHDYKSVYEDIKEWSKKVRKGGIVAGDDYMKPSKPDYPKKLYDVKSAVNDWVKKKKIKPLFLLVKENDRSWFYVKSR